MNAAGNRLVEWWTAEFTSVMEAMADQRPEMEAAAGAASTEGLLWWKQNVNAAPGTVIWVGAAAEAWGAMARRILGAAGIDSADEPEARGTWLEVLKQSLGGLAMRIGEQVGREVTTGEGTEDEAPPAETWTCQVTLRLAGEELPPLAMAVSESLLETMAGGSEPAAADSVSESAVQPGEGGDGESPFTHACRTLDLLLDVEMPVSVSFGRTQLNMQEVLKLITGSIIELDRTIAEPVEVIVNNCVIARGEVVVVEGNYGVRIHQILSRRERLQESRKYLVTAHG